MGIDGFGGHGGPQMGVNGLGWVWRGSSNYSGRHKVVGKVWDGNECMG